MAKKGHYININLASDAFEMLQRHCVVSGQTKTVAIERMIRACYGPNRAIGEDQIAAAQGEYIPDSGGDAKEKKGHQE